MDPNYKYLGKQGFPHAQNVDVYKFDNDFDYSRYDFDQMKITVCAVPWDIGEAHIGNRTIDGIGNVVYFETKEKRDEWFAAIPDSKCFRWETKYKELHRSRQVTVPIPFDVAIKYNYLYVQYHMFANDDSAVECETSDGVREWCYFIRNVAMNSANSSTLELLEDVWQTFIYDFNLTGMVLERGHAPLFAMQTDEYLQNPIENCDYLLAEDVSYGELQKVTATQATGLNHDNVKAVIATTSNVADSVGWSDDKTPAPYYNNIDGAPSVTLIALDVVSLASLLSNADRQLPQFKQTVQAVFFVEAGLLSLGSVISFCGVSVNYVNGTNTVTKDIFNQGKSAWNYSDEYSRLAKLYTFPYSALEIADEKGDTSLVKIEDTSGKITMNIAANLVFPYLNLQGTLSGIGGSASSSVQFHNVTAHTFASSGKWYEHIRQWDVPTFHVVLAAEFENNYSTKYTRAQMANDRDTAYTIATRDAGNANANAHANADASYNATVTNAGAAYNNGNNNANLTVNNAAAAVSANSSIVATGNSAASSDAWLQNQLAEAQTNWDSGLSMSMVNAENDAAIQTAAVSAVGSAVSGVASAISSAASGNIGGAVGSLVSGGISAATTGMTTAIATNLATTQANAVVSNTYSKLGETKTSNVDRTNNSNSANKSQADATNDCTTTQAANSASTQRSNASNSYNAAVGAASTIRDAAYTTSNNDLATANSDASDTSSNATNAINNQIKQANLRAPFVYGSVDNAGSATVKPQALYVNVVTQSNAAIRQAGDEFLRYGYRLNQQWDFESWNVGKHFTYWKLKDYWVKNNNMQDVYQDSIRFFLMGGVTVWRKPEDIGAVSIYDNFD